MLDIIIRMDENRFRMNTRNNFPREDSYVKLCFWYILFGEKERLRLLLPLLSYPSTFYHTYFFVQKS